ncbi:hypothetical protein K474DRAFT_1519062 [Panus rudis PR-1116 ss-1]|nr:hypothetical protein K474DRAFT_1519062 [Panus rudis PR-1116 ss-1]
MRFTLAIVVTVAASCLPVFSLPLEERGIFKGSKSRTPAKAPIPQQAKPTTNWVNHVGAISQIVQTGTDAASQLAQTAQNGQLVRAQIEAENAQASAAASMNSMNQDYQTQSDPYYGTQKRYFPRSSTWAGIIHPEYDNDHTLLARGRRRGARSHKPSSISNSNTHTSLQNVADGLNVVNTGVDVATGIMQANQQANMKQYQIDQLNQQSAAAQAATQATSQQSTPQRRMFPPYVIRKVEWQGAPPASLSQVE